MTIMLPFQTEEISPKVTIKKLKSTSLPNKIEDLLVLSNDEFYQDTTIICQNGRIKANSSLLAAMFPAFRVLSPSLVDSDSELVISVPDLEISDLELFFTGLKEKILLSALHR